MKSIVLLLFFFVNTTHAFFNVNGKRTLIHNTLDIVLRQDSIIAESSSASSASASLLSHSSKNDHDTQSKESFHLLHLTYENQSTTIDVKESETILSALERNRAHNSDPLLLSIPSIPQECRKGNCLTCAACHIAPSNKKAIETKNDGLAPRISDLVNKEGFVQTCSSYVTGEGLHLELGVCDDIWKKVWKNNEEGERIRNAAMAKTIRLSNEKNLHRWHQKTEKMFLEK
mmetsp:Transcript_9900/g.12544  ORF Transcript_9900/g.12544 Transcript_9900/m.12544 type:complete len:230 (-) Transcript_9900:6-695(-)